MPAPTLHEALEAVGITSIAVYWPPGCRALYCDAEYLGKANAHEAWKLLAELRGEG